MVDAHSLLNQRDSSVALLEELLRRSSSQSEKHRIGACIVENELHRGDPQSALDMVDSLPNTHDNIPLQLNKSLSLYLLGDVPQVSI